MSVIWITCNDKKFQARLRILLRVWKPDRRSVFSFHVTRLSVHVSIEFRSIYKWMSMWWIAIHKWDKKKKWFNQRKTSNSKKKSRKWSCDVIYQWNSDCFRLHNDDVYLQSIFMMFIHICMKWRQIYLFKDILFFSCYFFKINRTNKQTTRECFNISNTCTQNTAHTHISYFEISICISYVSVCVKERNSFRKTQKIHKHSTHRDSHLLYKKLEFLFDVAVVVRSA